MTLEKTYNKCVRGLGTRNALLRYGICVPCSKRLPGVRDAFSEAFGVKNRLFWYGRDIRYRKQPPVVRDAFSETFGDKKGLLWYATHLQRCAKQPPAPPNAFSKAQKRHPATLNASSKACRAKSSTCPPDASSVRRTVSARRRANIKRGCSSKSIKTF